MAENQDLDALAISGGGYRASLYALGSLWRLNELGILKHLKRITSVSGGAITAGVLAMNWRKLNFKGGKQDNLIDQIVGPVRYMCSKNIDIISVLKGITAPEISIGDEVAGYYSKYLFRDLGIQDLPEDTDIPEFIFYGSNFQTGSSVIISKPRLSDYKIGYIEKPEIKLAKVVAISSAFPPLLSPVTLRFNPNQWKKHKKHGLSEYFHDEKLRNRMILTDGGLYDNMGLESVWNDGFDHVYVCDAGAPFKIKNRMLKDWVSQTLRIIDVTTDQDRKLRKRTLIKNYMARDESGKHSIYGGAYFGIASEIKNYSQEGFTPIVNDTAKTKRMQTIKTRLKKFSKRDQCELINWGYAMTDTAKRRWVDKFKGEAPGNWPYPEFSLAE